ncbi:unnamed protein product [marine sediment metagenome]|uniref:Uncharacterized protein n=1 Tax=marine sediment metagenome TaxID=412755 RepID=X1TL15_9ZZZZ
MKSKTQWYISLLLILFGTLVMSTFNHLIGLVIFGLAAYSAGAYHIKFRIEEDDNEFKKLFP